MSLIVRELVVRATLTPDQKSDGAGEVSGEARGGEGMKKPEVMAKYIDQVMEILERKEER